MALQVVGGAFLGAFFNVLLERISSPDIKTFFETKKLNGKLLKRLKIKLLSVHGVLEDAEGKQFTSVTVKEWLDELKDVAFDADDFFDQMNSDNYPTASEVHNSNFTSPNSCDRKLGHKIEEILEKLESLVEEKDVLHLQEGLITKLSCKTPSSSLVEQSDVFGRDGDREALIQLLLSEDPNGKRISVIPIVGMGGIGKTTLAQIVFNDWRVEDKFRLKAWVYVSQEFDVVKVTKAILEAITLYASATNDLNSLQLDLKDRLKGKKFLIVLDDVWNENYDAWFDLHRPFQYGAHGSKIIVTTRSGRVASIMQTVKPHHLELLSDEDCWELFERHAFDYEDSSKPNFEEIGRKIVKKCNGLPLAAKTLGGILRSKADIQEWDNILKSEIRDISENESSIIPAVRLSYYYLHSQLKQCFAYCSIFPKDYEFDKTELILLWMAENLIQPKGKKRIEDIGEEYFHELVTRSLFQPLRNDKSRYVMHDLINDLAQFISGKFSVRLENEEAKRKIERRTRHLSVVCRYCLVDFESLDKASHLRTFFAPWCLFLFEREEIKLEETFLKLSFLRVLCLSRFSGIEELPDSIGFLTHLRYLDVSKTRIKWIPESICSLYNLQTLKATSCLYLKKLPQGLHNLINLRYLDVNDSYQLEGMPPNMGKLRNLQMLSDFIVGKEYGCSISELGQLVDLRGELFIQNLQHIGNVNEAKEANLNNKEYLQRLFLDWGTLYSEPCETSNSRHEKDVLDNLRPHPRNLELIAIYQYMGTEFPNWLGDCLFLNLVSVRLRGCKHCFLLPSLGHLPPLKDLLIEGFEAVVTVGAEFYKDVSCATSNPVHPFASLESLTFVSMHAWENWCHVPNDNESYKAFPRLRCLVINDCPRLTGNLPHDLPFMEEISTRNCPNLDTSQILSRLSSISLDPLSSRAMGSRTPSTSNRI